MGWARSNFADLVRYGGPGLVTAWRAEYPLRGPAEKLWPGRRVKVGAVQGAAVRMQRLGSPDVDRVAAQH